MRLIPEVTKEYNFAKILIHHRMISLFHIVTLYEYICSNMNV